MENQENRAVRRIHSEAKFVGLPPDPYRALERSQSAKTLLQVIDDSDDTTDINHESPHHNVSECSKVYLDLSHVENSDEVLMVNHLSNGPIEEEKHSKCVFSTGNEQDCVEGGNELLTQVDWSTSLQQLTQQLKQNIDIIKSPEGVDNQIQAIRDISLLMEQAWAIPTYGRDVAYSLCDTIREESALDIIIRNCASQNKELLKMAGRLLDKILSTGNRQRVASNGLEIVVKMTVDTKGEFDMARFCTGILESLFKTSEEICRKLTQLGGLDVILYWCRCNDRLTLRHCAIGLSNMALYGGPENQQEMARHKVPEWLFPLAFNDDDSVRYYACLAISVLVANKEIEAAVLQSGTLDLVLPFIASHTPSEFGRMDLSHRHGRSRGWLKRLVPLLSSKREESEALAAFHFAMEAGIKSLQKKTEVFYEVGAIKPLKRLASSPNATTSKLACEALRIIGENLPHKLTAQVPVWTVEDVKFWISQIGFEEFAVNFEKCKVDGDILLTLTEEDLNCSLKMHCRITHKRFMRELKNLKISADYASSDPSRLNDFLSEVGSEFTQYTYSMLQAGVDTTFLPMLTETQLINDCGINNGIHRSKMLQKIQGARKRDGTEYEPDTISSIKNSIDRHLKNYKINIDIKTDERFSHSRRVLEAKRKQLKSDGKGNKKNRAQSLDEEDTKLLYEKQILGCGNPQSLLNTVWMNNGIYFGFRGRQDHVNLLLGDLELKEDSSGNEYLEFTVLQEQMRDSDTGDSIDGRKTTDVFISYRRSNGSMLASLLKVFLQLRGFTVFLDIEKLNAGKFDEGLLANVKNSKNFIMVLTPNSLDRCVGDSEKKDWVHREIVAALESKCNIIPIMDSFHWPPADQLPEDMRQICFFNGIRWIHDYQDACVEKLERFLRGEVNVSSKRAGLFQMGSSTEGMMEKAKYSSSSSPSDSPNSDCS